MSISLYFYKVVDPCTPPLILAFSLDFLSHARYPLLPGVGMDLETREVHGTLTVSYQPRSESTFGVASSSPPFHQKTWVEEYSLYPIRKWVWKKWGCFRWTRWWVLWHDNKKPLWDEANGLRLDILGDKLQCRGCLKIWARNMRGYGRRKKFKEEERTIYRLARWTVEHWWLTNGWRGSSKKT